MNSDCPKTRACRNQKCYDPCAAGVCGSAAECHVTNHAPHCSCPSSYTGNPSIACHEIPRAADPIVHTNPCVPSPCGPYSQCRDVNEHAVCSCLVNYMGVPPACRPECTSSSDCDLDMACLNQRCVDPCPGTCGLNARCQVNNHNPVCSCALEYTGDPFQRCVRVESMFCAARQQTMTDND